MESTDQPVDAVTSPLKRKRSLSPSIPPPASAPVAKSAKSAGGSQLSINYLARSSNEDLPLINKEDSLPNLLHLLSSYSSILDRHESLASNLGARPLGPILIKRFERCFDAPPKIVASHHKTATTNSSDDANHIITWLDVIEFARAHPSQFTLTTFSEGMRVCQFYYPQKQLRVQISEEDFLFINSGRCQELIPPLPIWEDEEKEVGTCEVLEAKLKELTNAADMIAARTRQLSHRLKGRRAAILERRAEGGSGTPAKASAQQTTTAPPSAAVSGFTAVNTANGRIAGAEEPSPALSAAIRSDLMRHFEGLPQNQHPGRSQSRHATVADPTSLSSRQGEGYGAYGHYDAGRATSTTSSLSPVPPSAFASDAFAYPSDHPGAHRASASVPPGHRHSSSTGAAQGALKHNFSRPLPPALESSQPFRPLCQAHMDGLPRGHRVLPPCDRCRRLRMDCVKNLTSCAGCTKKHARCHWRDVSRDELGALDHLMDSAYPGSAASPMLHGDDAFMNGGDGTVGAQESDDDSNPLEDLEALGEQEEREREREDEQGLQSARELAKLARLDWEDGLRSTQLPDASGAAPAAVPAPVALPDATMADVNGDGNQQTPVIDAKVPPSDHLPLTPETERVRSYDPVHSSDESSARKKDDFHASSPKEPRTPLEQSSVAATVDHRVHESNIGGFRAVNSSHVGGDDAQVNNWRG